MPVKYSCPYSQRARGFPHLMCALLYPLDGMPGTAIGKANVVCAHQYLCPQTNRWELSPNANNCPRRATKGGEG